MRIEPADVVIRRMSAADLPLVIEIAAGVEHAPRYPLSTWLALLDPGLVPRRLALAAAGPSGAVLGFAVAGLIPPMAELESIAVARSSQRRQIGRRLLLGIQDELRGAGIHEIWLEVRVSNAPAIALYRRLGFRETGRRARYYTQPVEDAVLMSLRME